MAYDRAKFEGFDQMLKDAKKNGVEVVLVHSPQVLGDDYEELVANLNKLAAKELALKIVPPLMRQTGPKRA